MRTMLPGKEDPQRGAALLTVLVFALILTFSALGFFKIGDLEGERFHTDKRFAQALYAAEAGMNKLRWLIEDSAEIHATTGNPCDPCLTNPFDEKWYTDDPAAVKNVEDIITLINPKPAESFYPEGEKIIPYYRGLDVRGQWGAVRFLLHGAVDMDKDGMEGLDRSATLRAHSPSYLQVEALIDQDDINRFFEGYLVLPGSLGDRIAAGAKNFYDGANPSAMSQSEIDFTTEKGERLELFRFHEMQPIDDWTRWGYIFGKPILREEEGKDDLPGAVRLPSGMFDADRNVIEDYFASISMKHFDGDQTFGSEDDPTADIADDTKAVLFVDGDVSLERPDFEYISTTGQHKWRHTDVVIIAKGRITVKNPQMGASGRLTLIARDIDIYGEWGDRLNGLIIAGRDITLGHRSDLLPFDQGTEKFVLGKDAPSVLTGEQSGAQATILGYSVKQGSWEAGDARGTLVLENIKGDFIDKEIVTADKGGAARVNLCPNGICRDAVYTYRTTTPTYWSAYLYGAALAGNRILLNQGAWTIIYEKDGLNGRMFQVDNHIYERGEAYTECWSNSDPDGGDPEMIFRKGSYLDDESRNDAGDSRGTGDPGPQYLMRIASRPDIKENGEQKVGVGESVRYSITACGKDPIEGLDDWSRNASIRFYMALDNYERSSQDGNAAKKTWKEAEFELGIKDVSGREAIFPLARLRYFRAYWGKGPYRYQDNYIDSDIYDGDPADNYLNGDLPRWISVDINFSRLVEPGTSPVDFSKVSEFFFRFTSMATGYVEKENGGIRKLKEIRYEPSEDKYLYYENQNGPFYIGVKGEDNRLKYCLLWNENNNKCVPNQWKDIKWDKDHDGEDENIVLTDLTTTLRLDRIELPGGLIMNYGLPSALRLDVSKWREVTDIDF